MNELYKQVSRAGRRLTYQRFIDVLGWCWFAALAAALLLILINKFWPLGVSPGVVLAGALGIGLAAAGAWTFFTRRKALEAALEIDRRFGLKERVSSAVAMPEDQRASEAGQAVAADAVRRVARLEVLEKFPVRPPRQLLLPLAPALAALLAAWLINPAGAGSAAEAEPAAAFSPAAVKKAAETVKKQLAQRRAQAKKEGLPEAEQIFKKLEERSQDLAAHPEKREKTLAKLNDLSRQLDQRRQQLGGAEKMKEQLDALRNTDRGPADKFAKALSQGDLQKAGNELKKLEEALKKGNLDAKQKEDLAKQMQQMQEKLDKLVKAQQAAEKDLQKQIEKLRQSGQKADAEKAKELEKQLQQLKQQRPQMQQLQKMANQLGQCAQCLKQGNSRQAADALNQMQNALGDMQKQVDEMEMLDEAMTQIAQAKDQMSCKECGGKGCPACQGGGENKDFNQWKVAGGGGKAQAYGARPESKSETSTYDSQVRQKVGPGKAVIAGMVVGPNRKGDAGEIQKQVEEARNGSTDPLSGRQLPRKHRQYAKEYLDQFREGK